MITVIVNKDHVNYNTKLFPKRQHTKTVTAVNNKVYFPDKFLLEQKFVLLQFPIVHKINCAVLNTLNFNSKSYFLQVGVFISS